MVATLALSVAAAQDARQTTEPRPPAPDRAKIAAAPKADIDPTIDKILSRLEEREVRDLAADVKWTMQYAADEPEDAQTKLGTIAYLREKPAARFLIDFKRKVVGGRADKLDEKYLFDGVWYVEVKPEGKSVFKKQVRRASDPVDPFRLGEGPFPVPFGQRKDDILREFEVTLAPPAKNDPENTDHLRLKPLEHSRFVDLYRYIDFWIAREGPESGLPIQVRTEKLDGTGKPDTIITIAFSKPRLNAGLSASVFQVEVPPGFEVEEEPLPEPQASLRLPGEAP
jgi:hypothetical protein